MASQASFDLTNTKEVLEQFGNEVIEAYREELTTGGINTSEKNLYNSLKLNPIKTDKGHLEVSINLLHYWKYIEAGRRAGKMPPVSAIRNWVEIKPIPIEVSRTYSGKLPSGGAIDEDKMKTRVAWAIAKGIERKGIVAKPILAKSVTETFENLKDALSDAIGKDMATAVVKVFGSDTTFVI